jgi:hypothetical protein
MSTRLPNFMIARRECSLEKDQDKDRLKRNDSSLTWLPRIERGDKTCYILSGKSARLAGLSSDTPLPDIIC